MRAFQPIDRDHTEKGTRSQEPWVERPATGGNPPALYRDLATDLMPYLYTVLAERDYPRPVCPCASLPLVFEFPDAAADHHPLDLGSRRRRRIHGRLPTCSSRLQAAFPDEADAYEIEATLFSRWYDFWTGDRVEESHAPPLADGQPPGTAKEYFCQPFAFIRKSRPCLSLFALAQSFPISPLVQSTSQRPEGPLKLRVFPGPSCAGELYQDDGTSFAYKQGNFLRMKFTCDVAQETSSLAIHIGKHEGSYPAWWREIAVEIDGLSKPPGVVTVDGRTTLATSFEAVTHSVSILLTDNGKGMDVVVSHAAQAHKE